MHDSILLFHSNLLSSEYCQRFHDSDGWTEDEKSEVTGQMMM